MFLTIDSMDLASRSGPRRVDELTLTTALSGCGLNSLKAWPVNYDYLSGSYQSPCSRLDDFTISFFCSSQPYLS